MKPGSPTIRRQCFGAVLFLAFQFFVPAMRGRDVKQNHANGIDWHVDLDQVIPIGSSAKSGYRIHLAYEFSGRKSVWLSEVGNVEPSGDLTFVFLGDTLVFRSAKDSEVLASLHLQPTSYLQPTHGDEYPATAGETNWVLSPPILSLPQNSVKTIRTVLDGIRQATKDRDPRVCRPDDEGCFISPWTLVASDQNLEAEVSVLITFKDEQGQSPTTIKLYYLKRQGYKGSSGREPSGEMVDKAAPAFLANLRRLIEQPSNSGDVKR